MKLLIVCLGNICRSPMAEGILRKKIADRKLGLEVDSAGTADYHVGESPDPRAISVSKNYGVDISDLRGRQFNASDFDRYDLIYAMDDSNFRNITKLARNENDRMKVFFFITDGKKGMNVPDPWFGDEAGFHPVFKLLENAAERILDDLEKEISQR